MFEAELLPRKDLLESVREVLRLFFRKGESLSGMREFNQDRHSNYCKEFSSISLY